MKFIAVGSCTGFVWFNYVARILWTEPLAEFETIFTKALLGTTILSRPAQPEVVSAAALFLASDEASFMTGSEMVVDGGYTAQ